MFLPETRGAAERLSHKNSKVVLVSRRAVHSSGNAKGGDRRGQEDPGVCEGGDPSNATEDRHEEEAGDDAESHVAVLLAAEGLAPELEAVAAGEEGLGW